MATTPAQRAYTCDVAVFALDYNGAAATSASVITNTMLGWFKDATIRVDVDTENAYVPHDTTSKAGFLHDVPKARRWSLDLSAVAATSDALADREFGWQLSVATAAGKDVLSLFTSLDISYNATLMEARVPHDTQGAVITPVGTEAGWAWPRFKSNNWEFEFQGLVDDATAANNPFNLIVPATVDAVMPTAQSFAIKGPNIEIAGTGTPTGGQLGFGDETLTQNYRIRGQGDLTTNTVFANTLVSNLLTGTGTGRNKHLVGVAISQPGAATVYEGYGFFTSAKFTGSDGPSMQSGTVTGRGALLSGVTLA